MLLQWLIQTAWAVFLFFFSLLQIYKDSQFNNIEIKSSKIQVQNKTQILRKSDFSQQGLKTWRKHIKINNKTDKQIK